MEVAHIHVHVHVHMHGVRMCTCMNKVNSSSPFEFLARLLLSLHSIYNPCSRLKFRVTSPRTLLQSCETLTLTIKYAPCTTPPHWAPVTRLMRMSRVLAMVTDIQH